MILFEMLVGQPPFLAPTPTETQLKVSLIPWHYVVCVCVRMVQCASPEPLDSFGPLVPCRLEMAVIYSGGFHSYFYYSFEFL